MHEIYKDGLYVGGIGGGYLHLTDIRMFNRRFRGKKGKRIGNVYYIASVSQYNVMYPVSRPSRRSQITSSFFYRL